MRTKLIISTSLDEARKKRDEVISELGENVKNYGDDVVTAQNGDVYFFKVISLTDFMGKLNSMVGKGYDELDLSSLLLEVKALSNTIEDTIELKPSIDEATEAVLNDKKEEDIESIENDSNLSDDDDKLSNDVDSDSDSEDNN